MTARALRLVVAAAPVALIACGGPPPAPEGSEPGGAALPVDAVPVHIRPATPRSGPPVVVVPGRLTRSAERTLAFRAPGYVAAVPVDEGDPVRAGQTVARLHDPEAEARLAVARADADQAGRTVARFERLHTDSVVSLAQLQDARDALARATAAVDAAAQAVGHTVLRAPGDGRITARLVELDEWVGPGDPVVRLSAGDSWTVDVALADRDAVRIAPGAAARITAEALPGTVLAGRVTRTGAGADPATGTLSVEVTLDATEATLRSGLVVRVELERSGGSAALSVPAESVVEAGGGRGTVFVVEADTARARRVDLVEVDGAGVSVRGGGLREGVPVVTTGAAYLRDGTPVAVVDGAEPDAPDGRADRADRTHRPVPVERVDREGGR